MLKILNSQHFYTVLFSCVSFDFNKSNFNSHPPCTSKVLFNLNSYLSSAISECQLDKLNKRVI